MNFLIVDDHPIYTDGLELFLKQRFTGLQITKATCADSALNQLQSTKFDLIVIDFHLPEVDGHTLLKALAARGNTTPVVITSGEETANIAKKSIDFGAQGFIPKSLPPKQLADAFEDVLNGDVFLTENMQARVDQLNRQESVTTDSPSPHEHNLTARQLEVLKLLAKGYGNKRISQMLNVSGDTVKEHISNIFIKLQANNRVQCVSQARKLGLELED